MNGQVTLCRGPKTRLLHRISENIAAGKSRSVGVVSAYLSLEGARHIWKMMTENQLEKIAVVAGLSGATTHPRALEFLQGVNIRVRAASHPHGIFHPKFLVGGANLHYDSGTIDAPSCGYVGSGNFTEFGLKRNVEIGFLSTESEFARELALCFRDCWLNAVELDEHLLGEYKKEFRERIKTRSIEDLELLEMSRTGPATIVAPGECSTVWVGLESFTGERTFQVEFPVKAGEALRTLLGTGNGEANIECTDGQVRAMKYAYYADNSMYRLNVPNDVPLVDWARAHHEGALVVSRDFANDEKSQISAEIVRGSGLREIRRKSDALGTLGSTSTREYGWF